MPPLDLQPRFCALSGASMPGTFRAQVACLTVGLGPFSAFFNMGCGAD